MSHDVFSDPGDDGLQQRQPRVPELPDSSDLQVVQAHSSSDRRNPGETPPSFKFAKKAVRTKNTSRNASSRLD